MSKRSIRKVRHYTMGTEAHASAAEVLFTKKMIRVQSREYRARVLAGLCDAMPDVDQ